MLSWNLHQVIKSLRTPLAYLLTCVACIAVHELGHAAAAKSFGGHVSEFVLISEVPHVIVSGDLTRAQHALDCAAGSALLIAAWTIFALLIPAGRLRLVLEVSTTFVGIELFAWVLSAVLYPAGPENYDGWQFLAATSIPRLYVVSVCLATAAAVLFLYGWKTRERSNIPHVPLTPAMDAASGAQSTSPL